MREIDKLIEGFKMSGVDKPDISNLSEIPSALSGEDVYDMSYLFKNEDIAIGYCLQNSCKEDSYERIYKELHEDDTLMQSGDIRSAQVYICDRSLCILSELPNGIFILWDTY